MLLRVIPELFTVNEQNDFVESHNGICIEHWDTRGNNASCELEYEVSESTVHTPGLKSTSVPRKLNNHATSSSMLTTVPTSFFFVNCSRSSLILSSEERPVHLQISIRLSPQKNALFYFNKGIGVLPAYLTSSGNIVFFVRAGRSSPQTMSTGFFST